MLPERSGQSQKTPMTQKCVPMRSPTGVHITDNTTKSSDFGTVTNDTAALHADYRKKQAGRVP